jgi:hypothetical protein
MSTIERLIDKALAPKKTQAELRPWGYAEMGSRHAGQPASPKTVPRNSGWLESGVVPRQSDLTLLARPEYQFTGGVFYWRAVFILSVFEMEYRGKHYTIVQGVEPGAWSLLDHRIVTILQIRAALAVRMIELRRLRWLVQTTQLSARRRRRVR